MRRHGGGSLDDLKNSLGVAKNTVKLTRTYTTEEWLSFLPYRKSSNSYTLYQHLGVPYISGSNHGFVGVSQGAVTVNDEQKDSLTITASGIYRITMGLDINVVTPVVKNSGSSSELMTFPIKLCMLSSLTNIYSQYGKGDTINYSGKVTVLNSEGNFAPSTNTVLSSRVLCIRNTSLNSNDQKSDHCIKVDNTAGVKTTDSVESSAFMFIEKGTNLSLLSGGRFWNNPSEGNYPENATYADSIGNVPMTLNLEIEKIL